jgi:hypothetical protein
MSTYQDRLLQAMKANDYDVTRLAKELGISYVAASKATKTGALGSKNNLAAAKLLKVRADWLATGQEPMQNTDPFANPAPPLSNVYQIREAGSYYGKSKIIESIKILEGLSDEALLEAVYWLRGFAAGKESEKKSEATLPNHPVPTAPGAAG